MRFRFQPTFSVLFILLLSGCDDGLAPKVILAPQSIYGIRGTIFFKNWPPADSVVDLRLAALKNSPSSNIFNDVIQGRVRFSGTLLPYGADSISYELLLAPLSPGLFSYIGVAQQFGQNIRTDWRLVGVYHSAGDTLQPGTVNVPADSIVSGIDLLVDFQHLPPQPLARE